MHKYVPPHLRYQPKHSAVSQHTSNLPSAWLDCPSVGQEIANCLIPSKVPLDESYNNLVPHHKRYTFNQVIHRQRNGGRKLGLVIDLTNTSSYYRTSDLEREGIKHVRILCKGYDSVPDNFSVNRFVYEVQQFRENHPRKHILVHCTHGHNHTGYMIIHYLMRTFTMPTVTQAIRTFAEARPPGIYKPGYIEVLFSFYHERRPAEIVYPLTPEWMKGSNFDLGEIDQLGLSVPLQENHQVLMTNDDILGDQIPAEQQEELRRFCYQLLNPGGNCARRRNLQFPGSHPVSLNRDNMKLMRQQYYYATWKADGTRYMMLITVDGCYLIDRRFNFRRVQMRFPCKSSNVNDGLAEKTTHHYTLLDGEMVIDTSPGSQEKQRRFLIYDLIAINNRSVVNRPFHERWNMIEKEVIEPRNRQRQVYQTRSSPDYMYELEPFKLRRKDFWTLSTVDKLLKVFIPKQLTHDADGLIFQGRDDPYVQGTHEGLLKWKYPGMNSVDFLFEIDGKGQQLLFLYERGQKKLLEGHRVSFKDGSDNSHYSGKIIECSWDFEKKEWVCMRIRTDKSAPNGYSTYKKVMESIKDNITEEILLNEMDEIICLPMYVERMRHDSKAAQQQK